MKVQSIIFSTNIPDSRELLYRCDSNPRVSEYRVQISSGTILTTDCYANLFDTPK